MNYVIAVFPDRIQAEAAYSALEKAGLPTEQVSIVGKGYKSADEFEFIDPSQQARKQARLMSFWLVPFGFIAGVAFNLSTQYQLVPAVGAFGNQIIGGLLGAIGGAMGSFFVGGGVNLSFGGSDAVPYPKRLKQGKYLVVASGAPNFTNKATSILRQAKPENLQGFVDPSNV
jgi:hypothetical protein